MKRAQGRFRHLINAGHFAVEERPQEFAGYILAFMRQRGA
jgi:pimeloyl-ACP methyl ester carboxylesterase